MLEPVARRGQNIIVDANGHLTTEHPGYFRCEEEFVCWAAREIRKMNKERITDPIEFGIEQGWLP